MILTADPRERIASLGITILELQAQQEAFVDALIDDLNFQEIPIQILEHVDVRDERFHFVNFTREDSDKTWGSYHVAETCDMGCNSRFPSRRIKYGRKGRGTWATFLGTWEVVASYRGSIDRHTNTRVATQVCIPEGALRLPRDNAA